MSSRGNSLRVRLGDPIEGFRIGNRGDLEISCVARESLGDFLGSMLILGSLGDLLPLDIFGDFLPTQSSLSSMSLESEQLQLSIMADIRLLPYISSVFPSVLGSMMTNSGRSLLIRRPLRIGTRPPRYSRYRV